MDRQRRAAVRPSITQYCKGSRRARKLSGGSLRERSSLRAEVESLLSSADADLTKQAEGLSKLRKIWNDADGERSWTHEKVIGPYHLLEQIGGGGMGEVWLAEQKQPVRRKVALKLIKLGMDSPEVMARFDSERQALALMDHPAVAKVFDGGSTASGRPYFVMEYVPGIRLRITVTSTSSPCRSGCNYS